MTAPNALDEQHTQRMRDGASGASHVRGSRQVFPEVSSSDMPGTGRAPRELMHTHKICLVLIGTLALTACANGTAAHVNNTLSAPEHVNTTTEPQGKGSSSSPSPSSSK
jgi:hypothetical protein